MDQAERRIGLQALEPIDPIRPNASRPGAGRKHDHIGSNLAPVGEHYAVDTPAVGRNRAHRPMLADAGAG